MPGTDHDDLTGAIAVHPAAFVASTDPGAVGAHKFWVDTSTAAPFQLKKRNAANSAWENVGSIASLTDPTTTRGDLITRGVSVLGRLAVGAVNTILGSNGTDPAWTAAPTVSGELTALDLKASGMTGAANSVRIVGGNATGAPASGTFAVRDLAIDSDGTLWICTSAGSPGTWTQVSGAGGGASAAGLFALLGDYVRVEDQKASGTAGGTFTSGAWQTRTLNTEVTDTAGIASVATNQVTLPAGTYICRASAPAFAVDQHQLRLQNITGAATLILGPNAHALSATTVSTHAVLFGRFTLSVSSAIEVQHRGTTTRATDGFGLATSWGTEVYSVVEFWKQPDTTAYINIQDQKASATAGGTFTSGADRTRDLNTEVEDTHAIATLATNQITVPAGTYRCEIIAPVNAVNFHQAWLYNVTGAAVLIRGTSEFGSSGSHSFIRGRFTLSVSSALEVRHRCSATRATDGFGTAASFGTEVYTVVELWKEA